MQIPKFEQMGHLENALDWLSPLVLGSNTWDYCVVWKIGDDPSRYIEWVGCCCNGGGNQEVGSKKRKGESNMSVPTCRDVSFVHPANTKSCEALARLPSAMSLYSGVHGEVVISGRPWWLNIANTSDSKISKEETFGTQVLVPVFGGLIELFSTKIIAENENITDYVTAQFNMACGREMISPLSEMETMSNSSISFDDHSLDPLLDKSTDKNGCLSSLNQLHISPRTQSVIPTAHHYSESNLDGSSTGSFPSDERPSPDSTPPSVPHSIPFKPLKSCNKYSVPKEELGGCQRPQRKQCKSKNLVTERNRRKRINDGFLTLRSVVPKITKMHKEATLADAINYIGELHNEIKGLQHELTDGDQITSELKVSQLGGKFVEPRGEVSFNKKEVTTSPTVISKLEVEVEVNQLGTGHFLLKIVCLKRPGAFTKLLKALEPLGVLVNDVNVTALNGRLSCILMVQTNKKEIREKDVRDSLILVTA